MSELIIAGGGYAGMWAALAAARVVAKEEADVRITVVSKDRFLTIRPRLYECDPESMRVPLAPVFEPLGIGLLTGTVSSIDTENREVVLQGEDGAPSATSYDRLVIATGSQLRGLAVPGLEQYGFNIDGYDAAVALDRHLAAILGAPGRAGHDTIVIMGAGFTGIELATEMRRRIEVHAGSDVAKRARIILVEREETIGPELGENPRPVLEQALHDANVEVRTSTRVERVELDAVVLDSGERLPTKTVIVTVGQQANPLAAALPVGLDEQGRIPTDEMLRVKGLRNIYAAGDIARAHVDDDHLALMSCQHSMPMGRFAGYNAARDLMGLPLREYRQPNYVTCIDLGESGALLTSGWERSVTTNGQQAKQIKRTINTQWIYPPQGDREALLRAADVDAVPGA